MNPVDQLHENVLATRRCTVCGACLALCPHLENWRGRVVRVHDCDRDQGRCADGCPRLGFDPAAVTSRFNDDYDPIRDAAMGTVRAAFHGRAVDPRVRAVGQDGGVVTALVSYALEQGDLAGAVLTGRRGDLEGEGRVVSTSAEARACAGSRFAATPTLAAFNRAASLGAADLGVVGLPCQLQALAIMDDERRARASLRIGLFCTWAFDLRKLQTQLPETLGPREVLGLSVTPPPKRTLQIEAEGGTWSLPLDDVRACTQTACETCWDMTAELSDISVGSAETRLGRNTLLVRTERGHRLVQRALDAGILELEALSEPELAALRTASVAKKHRALERLGTDGYLRVEPAVRASVAREAEEVAT